MKILKNENMKYLITLTVLTIVQILSISGQ